MNELKIEYVDINSIKPYKNNPRVNDDAIQYVANSIKEFGFKNPIILDKENVIVCGHTRLEASKRLDIDKIPCLYADDLNEEQIKAFRLADNKVSEKAEWNYDLLIDELKDIDIDMVDFGFDILEDLDIEEDFEEEFKVNERERTNQAYNLELFDEYNCEGKWQMPIIDNDNYIPSDLIGFNYAKTSDNKRTGIHFYLDDYQFERVWNNPSDYVEILADYECILSPDFSLYLDMPIAMKIWNIYRSRLIGQYYQSCGIKVIPTISWAEEETFEFCFDGIPKGSIVSISTIGVKRDKDALDIWKKGMDTMIKHIKPSTILVYGGKLDYDYGDIKVIYYENKVTEKMKERND